jgi:hypothetical protein
MANPMPDKSSSPTPRRPVDVRIGWQHAKAFSRYDHPPPQLPQWIPSTASRFPGVRRGWLLLEPEHLVDGRV